jgi:hypothetical protein
MSAKIDEAVSHEADGGAMSAAVSRLLAVHPAFP